MKRKMPGHHKKRPGKSEFRYGNHDDARRSNFQPLIDINPESMLLINTKGTILIVNQSAAQLMEKPPGVIIGTSIYSQMDRHIVSQLINAVEEAIQSRREVCIEDRQANRYLNYLIRPIFDANGEVCNLGVIRTDLTNWKRSEEALRQSERQFEQLVMTSPVAIFLSNWASSKVVLINRNFTALLGYTLEDIPDLPHLLDLVYPDEEYRRLMISEMVGRVEQAYGKAVPAEPIEAILSCKDNSVKHVEIHVSHIGDMNHVAIVDISERKHLERRLKEMAMHVFLTGLPNRILLYDRLQMALAHVKRDDSKLAVMMVDIDGFKSINDNLGHDIGDELLKAIAGRLLSVVRQSDTVARLGGDEFVVLLPETKGASEAVEIAERILLALRHPFLLNGCECSISASIGIAMYPDNGSNIEELLKLADAAMYRIKNSGRDGCCTY